MKRSEINKIINDSLNFIEDESKFFLPPFAKWTVSDWQNKGIECKNIVDQQLGWDITDFGSGNFNNIGLSIFTVRNGTYDEIKKEAGRVYAEKILVLEEEQITPCHFHYQKIEDIINRGGGDLVIQVWNSLPDEGLDIVNDVPICTDGVQWVSKAGGLVILKPGESITIQTRMYHKFWGLKGTGKVLAGEVSRVNDDYVDNHFYEAPARFATIEEDEAPLFLLYDDYKKYYNYV